MRLEQALNGRGDVAGRVVIESQVLLRTEAGYPGLQSPYDVIWEARYAVVEDPRRDRLSKL